MHLSQQQLQQLAEKGYLALDLSDSVYSELFKQTETYFGLGCDSPAKLNYAAQKGAGASEEGHSTIPGEKQIFTCRTYSRTPVELRDITRKVWDLTGTCLHSIMQQIGKDMNASYDQFITPCITFNEQRTPTLLRLFRYERHAKSTIVAERHRDLGFLSLVIGSSPGLEVLDEKTNTWISIEENRGPLTATLLTGQTLRFLTRGQYRAGIHRVRCAPAADPYRYSIVYALRGYHAPIKLDDFQNQRTGIFGAEERARVDGKSMKVLFDILCGSHYNVNISKDIRDKQKKAQRKGSSWRRLLCIGRNL